MFHGPHLHNRSRLAVSFYDAVTLGVDWVIEMQPSDSCRQIRLFFFFFFWTNEVPRKNVIMNAFNLTLKWTWRRIVALIVFSGGAESCQGLIVGFLYYTPCTFADEVLQWNLIIFWSCFKPKKKKRNKKVPEYARGSDVKETKHVWVSGAFLNIIFFAK